MSNSENSQDFDRLLELLKTARGFDFSGYKRASLVRRVRKRMQMVGIDSYGDYVGHLQREQAEFDRLISTILINVTTFFRDGVPWGFLSEEIIPRILSQKGPTDPVRVWSAGCASGQEAYTLAMVLSESLGIDEYLRRAKIYATDVDDDALGYARQASYTAKEIEQVPELLRERYFEHQNAHWVFRKNLRRSIIFGRNDLIDDAPISKIDLLVCRNTLMYFDSATQAKILRRFHFALREGGFLFLGKAETLSTHTTVFEPVDLQRRVFTKVSHRRPPMRMTLREGAGEHSAASVDLDRELVSTAVFEKSPIAQFAIDRNGNMALINARARQLFRLSNADIGRALQDLEVSYRPVELRSLLDNIHLGDGPVIVPDVSWVIAGEQRWFEVQLLPLQNADREIVAVTVMFDDVTALRTLQAEVQRSHGELETAYEELQSTNEELETTNEELHSTVEELETTNEELHSSNEELETMNEELQSTNEELGAINEEMRRRGDQVNDLNRFLRSIFASLRGGVAVLDEQFRVKVWNHKAEDLWGVRSDEVLDQRFTDLDIGLPVNELKSLLQQALSDSRSPHERTVAATNRRGKGITCKVTSTPLLGTDHEAAQGVILIMEEVQRHD